MLCMTRASQEDSRPRFYPCTLALVSSWYGWWPMRLLHFVICVFPLPVVTRCG